MRQIAATVLIAALSRAAVAERVVDFAVAPLKLTISDRSAARRKIGLAIGSPLDGCGTSRNPIRTGAVLQIFSSAGGSDTVCYRLDRSLWQPSRNCTALYFDRALAATPVRSVKSSIQGPRLIEVRAVAANPTMPIAYTLDEPHQGSVAVAVSIPTDGRVCADGRSACATDADCVPPDPGSCQQEIQRGCANFTTPRTDRPGKFVAKGGANVPCPPPPPCSP